MGQLPLEHYLRLIIHRKWLVLGVFLVASVATAVFSYSLPNVYTAETVILVDPQKVPESYVKATVTGDVRNRLGTLSQQILSATRLQKIIDTLNLFPEERKKLTREELILRMRSSVAVQVLSDFSGAQDLQAFRITYSGKDPRMVAQVTNELANLFIEENLKARELQATGTTDFLQNQLQETRKALEEQEAKLKDFKLRHLGEMPEQQAASLQILGQLQSQLQLRGEALSRAEQQRSYTQNLMAGQAPVVDLDSSEQRGPNAFGGNQSGSAPISALDRDKAQLAELLARYKDTYPDVKKLKKRIEDQEAKQAAQVAQSTAPAMAASAPPPPPAEKTSAQAVNHFNPVLQSQLEGLDAEIAQNRAEVKRLTGVIGTYQAKLEAIPIREQQITQLVRDYEISKAHYGQLLNNQYSAETATQLEIRQKGEKFTVLDTAQVPEKPSRPNRMFINFGGSLAGLALGLLLALATEFLGVSITGPEQIALASGLPVLEVIPIIQTRADRLVLRKRIFWATAAGLVAAVAVAAVSLYHYYPQFL